jgi:hypothetical protein
MYYLTPQELKVLEVSVEEIRSGVIIKKNKISTQVNTLLV